MHPSDCFFSLLCISFFVLQPADQELHPDSTMDPRPQYIPGLLNPPKTRFPLSSPIDEEPTNPFGVPSNPFESEVDLSIQRSDDADENEENLGSRWSADSSVHGSRWSKRLARHNSKKTAKKMPGLNLVTNFSSLHVPKQRNQQRSQRSTEQSFLGLSDIKSLSKNAQSKVTKDRRLSWRRRSKGYAELTEEPKKRVPELSPSDRPIVIGMQVPRDSLDAGDGKGKQHDSRQKTLQGDITPVTPSIVITPAKKQSWDEAWDQQKSTPLRPPRPPSSVYSQHTPRIWNSRDVPPVPPLPEGFAKVNRGDDVFSDEPTPAKKRRASIATVFEDENVSPVSQRSRPRSLSDAARQRMFKGLSMETIATRRRSQGWWNYLLSPMLSRSNTVGSPLSVKSSLSARSPPPLPSAVTNWSDFIAEKNVKEISTFSPETPEPVSAIAEKSLTSVVTRWPWGSQDNVGCESPDSNSDHRASPTSAASSRTIPFMMSTPVDAPPLPSPPQHCRACIPEINANPYNGIPHTCSPNTIVHGKSPTASPESNRAYHSTFHAPLTTINENSNNPFFQKFVESLRNDRAVRPRPESASTTFEDIVDISPTVRTASVAPVIRADATPIPGRASPQVKLPEGSPEHTQTRGFSSHGKPVPRYKAIFPPGIQTGLQQPHSPAPITPGAQHIISGPGGFPLADTPRVPPPAHLREDRLSLQTDSSSDVSALVPKTHTVKVPGAKLQRRKYEREVTYSSKSRPGGLWLGFSCFGSRGYKQRLSDEMTSSVRSEERRKKRRWCVVIIVVLIIIIIILSIVLPIVLLQTNGGGATEDTEKPDKPSQTGPDDKDESPPVDDRWLNVTNFPPMPTGISTIAGPQSFVKKSNCVRPGTMWSCSLPKELHKKNEPYDADRPNFRIQISFQDLPDHSVRDESGAGTRMLHHLEKRALLDDADPPPPSFEDMEFLGNTTDGITPPNFAGEQTPFFASVLSPYDDPSPTIAKRATPSATNPFPDLTTIIPPPALDTDGTATPATLYPLPKFQPLRLYDRGLPTEHYGFYNYFDKSIFLKSTDPMDPSSNGGGDTVPDDLDGGSTKSAARVKCTWAQTRFLVQIWTRASKSSMQLLNPEDDDTPPPPATPSSSTDYANDFSIPGSFPYPVSITLDRHGGNPRKKMVYCYEIDVRGRIMQDKKKMQLEFRDAGGSLVNPPGGVFNLTNAAFVNDQDEDAGPIDGGTGGCMCEWRNWVVAT